MTLSRRRLLTAAAGASLAGCASTTKPRSIVVVGAGIVGASIAYHCSRLGAAVTVIDRLGPAMAASQGTFAWINASWAKQPRHYHRLNQMGVAGWHRLGALIPLEAEASLRFEGSLEWFGTPERQALLREQIDEQARWGEPARLLDVPALRAREPNLQLAGLDDAAYSGNDGAVDPVRATELLLASAQQLGATTVFPSELINVMERAGGGLLLETSAGELIADRLVLATGAAPDSARVFAGVELPQRSTPGVIVVTKPMPALLSSVVAAPGVHLHQRSDGRFVVGEQAGAPDTRAHAARLADRPRRFPSTQIANQHARRLLQAAESILPALGDAQIDDVLIGWRPLPIDGHPVLGFSPSRPNVYLAISHSGVTLAPVIGEAAAAELVSDRPVKALTPYRPGRSFERVRRY